MGGDYSRKSFDELRDFAGVFMQQGHVTLDADWNQLVEILERRLRAGTVDTIGRAVVPRETMTGFEIRIAPSGPPDLEIGGGRMYVHGLLAENHGVIDAGNPPIFDRTRRTSGDEEGVLDELISREPGDYVPYADQPYLAERPADGPPTDGRHLAYLDVWRREVTPLKDPTLLEPALGGIDTTTRWQTVWQVRLFAVDSDVDCATPDDEITDWLNHIAPSAARLTTGTVEFDTPDDPCLIPPGGGYRGLENQLYRVEIHGDADDLSGARFKWSRDNASVAAAVESFEADDRVIVRRIGRDSILRFRTNDWVEVTDDLRELRGEPGDMRRVTVDEDTQTLEFDAPLSADLIPTNVGDDTAANRHTRVTRWDQFGQVTLADGTPWEDLDDPGSDGLIPVPTDGSSVHLEHGVVVSFSDEPTDGRIRSGDYWCFAARTAGAQVEELTEAPPEGIHHHFARLAIVDFAATPPVIDCRTFWPPEFAGEGCACTVCVTADQHNSGELTIQDAIAQLPPEGGTVCLATGAYLLNDTPVLIEDRNSVRLRGQGSGTLLFYGGPGGAVRVMGCYDVKLDDFAIVTTPAGADPNGNVLASSAAVHLRNAYDASVQRLSLLVFASELGDDRGVALDGLQLDTDIEDCLIAAPIAIGDLATGDQQQGDPGYLGLGETRIDDNLMLAGDRAVSLERLTLHAAPVRVTGNLIAAANGGVVCTGAGLPGAPLNVERNAVSIGRGGNAVVLGLANGRVQDNELFGSGAATGSGIVLREGLIPEPDVDYQLVGNRIRNLDGAGLLVESPITSLMVKRNVVRDCGTAVTMGPEASIDHLALDNNLFEDIADTANLDGAPIAAVSLSSVAEARIAGNELRNVARSSQEGAYWAGYDLRGMGRLDMCGNAVHAIGPDGGARPTVAIRIQAPFTAINLSDNQLFGTFTEMPGEASGWTGIAITGAPRAIVGAAAFAVVPAYYVSDGVIFALSNARFVAVGQARERQLTANANQITDAHSGRQPLVFVEMNDAPGSCVFLGNQCRLHAAGQAEELVRIAASVIAASNNVVRRNSDTDAMRLIVGANGRATILGNLTFGNIRLEPMGMPPEFAPLNVLAP